MKDFLITKPYAAIGIIVVISILIDAFIVQGPAEFVGSILLGLLALPLTFKKNLMLKIIGYVGVALQILASSHIFFV